MTQSKTAKIKTVVRKKAKKAILGHPYVVLFFASVLALLSLSTFLYVILGVLVPAKRVSNGLQTECNIVSAKLSCWRRKPLSFSEIEQGHYSCWLFQVTYNEKNNTKPSNSENAEDQNGAATFEGTARLEKLDSFLSKVSMKSEKIEASNAIKPSDFADASNSAEAATDSSDSSEGTLIRMESLPADSNGASVTANNIDATSALEKEIISEPIDHSATSNILLSTEDFDDFEASNATCVSRIYLVQYSPVHAFPKERDNCDSLESCGNTSWLCNAVTSGSGHVRLRWKFPVAQLVLHSFIFLCTLGALAAFLFRQIEAPWWIKAASRTSKKTIGQSSRSTQSEIDVAFEDISSGSASANTPTQDFDSGWFERQNNFQRNMSTNDIMDQLEGKPGALEIDPHLPDEEIERQVDSFINNRSHPHHIIDLNR